MATLFQENNQEEDENQQPGQASAGVSGQLPSAPAGAGLARQQKGSGRAAINIGKYLEAQKQGGQQLASGIQQRAQEQAQQTQAGLQQAQQKFQQQAGQEEQRLGKGQQIVQAAFQDPQKLLQQQEQLQQFQQLKAGQLANVGQDISQQQAQAEALQQQAQAAGTEAGRFGLLKQTFGGGGRGYSTGQQRLDQLFLQASPGSARQLQTGLQSTAQQVGQQVQALSQEQQARQAALQQIAQQRQQEIASGLESETGSIQQSIEAKLKQAEVQAPQERAALQTGLEKGQLTQQQLERLGLTAGTSLYNVEPSKYLSQATVVPTAAGVASQEEVARLQALQQLAGQEGGFLAGTDIGQVGKYSPYEFQREQFLQDIAQRGEQYQRLQKSTQDFLGTVGKDKGFQEAMKSYARERFGDNVGDPRTSLGKAYFAMQKDPTPANIKKFVDNAKIMKASHGTIYDRGNTVTSALNKYLGELPDLYYQLDPTRQLQVGNE